MLSIKLIHLVEEDIVFDSYWKTEQKCKKYSKVMGTLYVVSVQTMFISSLCYSLYNIIVGNSDTSMWKLPLTIGFPISTESIWGWYFLLVFENLLFFTYVVCLSASMSYFISCCLYIATICNHFKFHMCSVREEIDRCLEDKNPNYRKKRIKIKKKLNKAIEMHVKAYEWVEFIIFFFCQFVL